MEKNVTFYFKNGLEQKIVGVHINDTALSIPLDGPVAGTVSLNAGKNRITLFFKEEKPFSVPLRGGLWDKIIVNEAKPSKVFEFILLGCAAICLSIFLLDLSGFWSVRFPVLPIAFTSIWFYFVARKSRYTILFR